MEEPIRVLLVEHRHEDCRVAHQLLTDYDLDFTWRSVASQGELHALADDFHPDIVLCADDSSNSSHSLLGALRLLCSRPRHSHLERSRSGWLGRLRCSRAPS